MGTDCKSAAFQLRWFESTRAHKKTANVEIRWRFSVCRKLEFPCGWIRTAAALSRKTAQKQPGGLFLAARLAQSTRAHKKTVSVEIRWRFSVCRGWRGCSRGQAGCPLTGLAGFYHVIVLKSRGNFNFYFFDEPGFRFFEIIQNIDRIVQKTMLMYQKRWN